MSNKTGTIIRSEDKISPGEDGYEYSVMYNHRGDIEEIHEDYFNDGFSPKEFLAEGIDPRRDAAKSKYSAGEILREFAMHETNDGMHELSEQLAENEKIEKVAVWLVRHYPDGAYQNGYIIIDKTMINDKKSPRRRLGRVSHERYLNYMLNHEGIHAVTWNEMASIFSSTKNKKEADKMFSLYKYIKNNYGKNGHYGLSHLAEFVAETYTSPEFQNFLSEVELPETMRTRRYIGGRNLLEKFFCVFDHMLRKREDVDLSKYGNVFDYISEATSNLAGSKINVVPLKGYGPKENNLD